MTAQTTTVSGDVGNSMSGGTVLGDLNQNQFFVKILSDMYAAWSLDVEAVRRIRRTFVPTPAADRARTVLQERSAVALVGSSGCGRRITAISLLTDLGLRPATVDLDAEDLRRSLDVNEGHGYLLDLDGVGGDQVTPSVGAWIADAAARARKAGACLVVRAGRREWSVLGIPDHTIESVPVSPPESAQVFAAHLMSLTDSRVAESWVHSSIATEHLKHVATPADAVRLAGIVRDVLESGVPVEQQAEEIRAAYTNWTSELKDWFGSTDKPEPESGHGRRRMLLIATAALNGAPLRTVCTAADRLAKLSGLPLLPGGPLVGPDLRTLIADDAQHIRDGRMSFGRPAYADAVLDHVWRERPDAQSILRRWLIELPSPAEQDTLLAAKSVLKLALRHKDSGLVAAAAMEWAAAPSLSDLAVFTLTAAAISEEIGGSVRRRLYRWAASAKTDSRTHQVIARVCAGELALAYPQIALTRLRHLAARESDQVRAAVVDAVVALAQERRLRALVLRELADWMETQGLRRVTAERAFLHLAGMRDERQRVLMLKEADQERRDLLVRLWRGVLHAPCSRPVSETTPTPGRDGDGDGDAAQTDVARSEAIIGWLEVATTDESARRVIIEIVAMTVESSSDVVNLLQLGTAWLRAAAALDDDARERVFVELIRQAEERDRLSTATFVFAPVPKEAS